MNNNKKAINKLTLSTLKNKTKTGKENCKNA